MAAGVVRTLGANSAFARKVRAVALTKIAEHCQPIADDAVQRADQIVSELYDIGRSGYRSKGGVSLHGSFRGRVESGGDFPVKIFLESVADEAKVMSLERGSVEHDIIGSPNLVFERSEPFSQTSGSKKRRRTEQSPTGGLVRQPAVHHPGTKAGRFMEQALASAVQARLRLARGLTVGGR